MATVREFSAIGPCIEQGAIIRETKHFYVINDRFTKRVRRIGKKVSGVHTEPCPSCRDHAHSHYPNGYEN